MKCVLDIALFKPAIFIIHADPLLILHEHPFSIFKRIPSPALVPPFKLLEPVRYWQSASLM